MRNIQKPSQKRKTTLIIALVALLVLGGLVVYLVYARQADNSERDQMNHDAKEASRVQESEQRPTVDIDATKDGSVAGQDQPTAPDTGSDGLRAVNPIVTGYNVARDNLHVEIDGGVNEIVESGGKCRFVVEWTGGSASTTTDAIAAASSTNCQTARITLSDLPDNQELRTSLIYSSSLSSGESSNNPTFRKEDIR